jgi:hypothetical protein
MKLFTLSVLATVIAATVVSIPVHAQNVKVHVSDSPLSGSSAMTIANARNALTAYMSACQAQDRQRIMRAMTADAEIEYAIDDPGQYLAVDVNMMDECWVGIQSINTKTGSVDMWIYLTPSPDVVFVDLVTEEGVGRDSHRSEHLAMVGMSGGRIAKIRDFTTSQPPSALAINETDSAQRR